MKAQSPVQFGVKALILTLFIVSILISNACNRLEVGIGAKAPAGAEMLFDGSREMLDGNWT